MTGQKLLELLFRLSADGVELRDVDIVFEHPPQDGGTIVRVLPGTAERDENGDLVFK